MAKHCSNCGKKLKSNQLICTACGEYVKADPNTIQLNQNRTLKWWQIVLIVLVCWIMLGAVISSNSNLEEEESSKQNVQEEEVNKQNDTQTATEEKKISREEYIESCQTIKFETLARNPDKYKGKKVKITGEVIQVSEGLFDGVDLRVNMTKNEYDFWEDTIYVEYSYDESEDKILEDDIITIYGEVYGSYSYVSILGSKITLPKVDAEYIVIN